MTHTSISANHWTRYGRLLCEDLEYNMRAKRTHCEEHTPSIPIR